VVETVPLSGTAAAGRYRAAVDERKRSEPYAFAALQTSLRWGNTDEAYRAMLTWLERLNPGMGMRQLARKRYLRQASLAVENVLPPLNP
jgi:hypothetical protein